MTTTPTVLDELDIWLLTEAAEWSAVAFGDDQVNELHHVDALVAADLLREAANPPQDNLRYFTLTDASAALVGV